MNAVIQTVGWLLGALGGGGVLVLALSGWLGKVWSDRMLKDYAAKLDIALAQANSAMRMAETRNQIVYSTLHAKRAELILDVYRRLGEIEKAANNMQADITYRINPAKPTNADPENSRMLVTEGIGVEPEVKLIFTIRAYVDDLAADVGENRILFSASTAELLDKFLAEAKHTAYWYLQQGKTEAAVNSQSEELARALAWRKSYDAIAPLRRQLEDEFRTLLGVEQQASATT